MHKGGMDNKQRKSRNIAIFERRIARLLELRGGFPRLVAAPGHGDQRRLIEVERARGMRFIVESEPGESLASVQSRMKVQLGPACKTEKLFRYYRPGRDLPRMANFFLSVIPGISPRDLPANAFDIGYEVAARTKFRSVIPDSGASVMSSSCDDTTSDPPIGWALVTMKVPEAWRILSDHGNGRGTDVLIGHPDTGYTRHRELGFSSPDEEISAGEVNTDLDYDFVGDVSDGFDPVIGEDSDGLDPHEIRSVFEHPGHGTGTASVMVSRGIQTGDDYLGKAPSADIPAGDLVGVAPDATVVPLRCVTSVVLVWAADVAQAVEYATVSKCHIVSMSLGGFPTPWLDLAIDNAVRQNLIVMAGAGNCVGFVVAPALFDNCLAVAACNHEDVPWKGSSHGPKITITAPGENVWNARTTQVVDTNIIQRFEGLRTSKGTSFAVANLAGVAALWLSGCGGPKAAADRYSDGNIFVQDAFRSVIRSTAQPQDWDTNQWGPGIVNAEAVIKKGCIPPGEVELPENGHRPDGGPDDVLAWIVNMLGLAGNEVGMLKVKLMALLDASDAEFADRLRRYGPEFVQLLAQYPERAREFREQIADDVNDVRRDAEAHARDFIGALGDAVSHTLRTLSRL